MKAENRQRRIVFLFLLVTIVFTPAAGAATPSGIEVGDEYIPGKTAKVGVTMVVEGGVVVVHENMHRGHRAKNNQPLFSKDSVYSLTDGRIRFGLRDGSTITLSSETTLTLTRGVYDPEKKERTSLLDMTTGKARFLIRSVADFRRTNVKVKTRTSIVGVRGSDFIIVTDNRRTEITALADTRLAVFSLAELEAPPVILTDYQRVVVELGQPPSELMRVSPEEVEEMIRDLALDVKAPSETGIEERPAEKTQKAETKEQKEAETTPETTQADQPAETKETADKTETETTTESAQSDQPAKTAEEPPATDEQAKVTSSETTAEAEAPADTQEPAETGDTAPEPAAEVQPETVGETFDQPPPADIDADIDATLDEDVSTLAPDDQMDIQPETPEAQLPATDMQDSIDQQETIIQEQQETIVEESIEENPPIDELIPLPDPPPSD